MRVLIVGSGGIARRHAANLRPLSPGSTLMLLHRRPEAEIDRDLLELVDATTTDLAVASGWEPEAAVVANAAPAHVATATALARRDVHLLVEKPLGVDLAGIDDLVEASRQHGSVVLVGYCLRFHAPLRRLRDEVHRGLVGRPLSVLAEAGQFLPTWRPGIDWRTTVTARAELGGGAIFELSHEIDYETWIMGPVTSVGASTANLGGLGIDVEDVADIHLGFRTGAMGSVHLDLLQRVPARSLKVIGSDATVVWDAADDSVRASSDPAGGWRVLVAGGRQDRNEMYVEEMRHFLGCINGSATPEVPIGQARHVLEVCLAAKRSALAGRVVTVGDDDPSHLVKEMGR